MTVWGVVASKEQLNHHISIDRASSNVDLSACYSLAAKRLLTNADTRGSSKKWVG